MIVTKTNLYAYRASYALVLISWRKNTYSRSKLLIANFLTLMPKKGLLQMVSNGIDDLHAKLQTQG